MNEASSDQQLSSKKKKLHLTKTEYHVFQSMRRVKRAIPFKRIMDLTGVSKKKLKDILKLFNNNEMLFSPKKGYYGLQGNYHGTPLLRYEYEAMKELESLIGKPIPLVEKVDLCFGFVMKDYRVKELGLYKQHIDHIPESISRFKILEVLDLGYNNLKVLPKVLTNLTQLIRLNLMWNQFSELPKIIRQIVTINELEFQGNKLTSLPDWISSLTFLDAMDFSHNLLTNVNPKISDHPNLRYLELWNNEIKELPYNIGNLNKLERLILSKNNLSELPPSFIELKNLKILMLDDNQFTSFPPELKEIKSLTKIDLSYNELKTIPNLENVEITCLNEKGIQISSMHKQRIEDLNEINGSKKK